MAQQSGCDMCLQVAVLPSLTAADIGEVIKETRLLKTSCTVMAQLRLTEGKRFDEFCTAIKNLSGGIPLFVLRALQVGACQPAALLHKSCSCTPVTELLLCRVLCTLSWTGRPWRRTAFKAGTQQQSLWHATLMLHALLKRPLPAAEVATDDGLMLRIPLSTKN